MRLFDINPFIRYIHKGKQRVIGSAVRTYDNRLFYILEGECTLLTEEKRESLLPGTLVLLRGGTTYTFEGASDMQMIVLNFDFTRRYTELTATLRPTAYADFDPSRILETEPFEDCEVLNEPLLLHGMKRFEKPLSDMVQTHKTARLYAQELASASLKLFLCELAGISAYARSGELRLVDRVLEYIRENHAEDLDNKRIAELFGYHPYYLGRLVTKQSGKPIHRHLLDCRLDTARELLIHSELSVLEIAERCGFKSTSHFSNFFKEQTSLSPLIFRKSFANRL